LFARGLGSAAKLSAAAKECVRLPVRAVVRDQGRGNRVSESELTRHLQLAGDRVLTIDLPAPEASTKTPLQSFAIAAQDSGTLNIQNVALTPRRRVLVALGEAGARLYFPSGRELVCFDAPAQKLVISGRGDRARAPAQRGSAWLVSKLDLLGGTSREWATLPLTQWTADFHCQLWFVVARGQLPCLDASAKPLWNVDADHPHALSLVTRGAQRGIQLDAGAAGERVSRWFYVLPSITLRERNPIQPPEGAKMIAAIRLDEHGQADR